MPRPFPGPSGSLANTFPSAPRHQAEDAKVLRKFVTYSCTQINWNFFSYSSGCSRLVLVEQMQSIKREGVQTIITNPQRSGFPQKVSLFQLVPNRPGVKFPSPLCTHTSAQENTDPCKDAAGTRCPLSPAGPAPGHPTSPCSRAPLSAPSPPAHPPVARAAPPSR